MKTYYESLPPEFPTTLAVEGMPSMHMTISHPGEGLDLYGMTSGINRGHLAEYMDWVQDVPTLTDAINYNFAITDKIREGKYLQYRIREGELGDATAPKVGTSTFYDIDRDRRRTKMGWWVIKGAEGKGYASRATERLLLHGREVLGLALVEAQIAVGNERSEHLAMRLGFSPGEEKPFPIVTNEEGQKDALMIRRWFKDL